MIKWRINGITYYIVNKGHLDMRRQGRIGEDSIVFKYESKFYLIATIIWYELVLWLLIAIDYIRSHAMCYKLNVSL